MPGTQPQQHRAHRMSPKPREPAAGLVGRWEKSGTDVCAAKYPQTLEFAAGTFRGTRGPGQGFVWWDAGIWRIETDNKVAPQLVLTTASDELVSYAVTLRGDSFEVSDDQGCRFTYRRAKG